MHQARLQPAKEARADAVLLRNPQTPWRRVYALHPYVGYVQSRSLTVGEERRRQVVNDFGYFDHQGFYIQALADDPAAQAAAREAWRRVVAPIVRNPYLQDPDVFVKNPALRDHIYLDAEDFDRNVELDAEFHTLFCEFHGNGQITRVMLQLRDKIHRAIVSIAKQDSSRIVHSYREHLGIADAVIAGEAERAASLLVEHLEAGRSRILSPRGRARGA